MVVVQDELMYHLSSMQPHPSQLALPLLSFGFQLWVSCFFPSGAGLSRVACHGPRGTPTTTAVDSSRGRAREGDRRATVAGDNDILLTG